jgi:hypothetical protein
MIIQGNTLFFEHESGNLGHYFNDHIYSSFAYYLENKNIIDNIYIEIHENEIDFDILEYNLVNKIFSENNSKTFLNFNMILMFLYDEKKNIYIKRRNDNKYIFKNLIKPDSDRFFEKYKNYIEVFNHLIENYKLYIKNNNIKNDRVDVTILYRSNGIERNIYNIELFENKFKNQNISYNLFDTSKYFNFIEILSIFYFSDNIVSFHGCELTYGIFMEKNTQIIELSEKNHTELWWDYMSKKYINYGLEYKRVHLELLNKNLVVNDNICNTIINLIKIKTFDNFISLGEVCDNTISLYNINYKNGSYPFDYIISNLKRINEIIFTQKAFNDDDIINKSNFLFPHHNINNNETENEYVIRLKNMFNNKLNNLYNLITSNKRILFMYTKKYGCNVAHELNDFVNCMIEKLNYNNFKLLVILNQDENTDISTIINNKKIILINYRLDREKHDNYGGTDYGDFKIRQFIGNYLLCNFNCKNIQNNNNRNNNANNMITNIIPIGSRCINASILEKYNLKKYSNVFDSINIKYIKNTFDVILSNFDNLINYKNLKKKIQPSHEIKTMNILYDDDNDLTFPHFNLFDKTFYETYKKRIERFRKTKYYNNLFVFTITGNKSTHEEIIYWCNQLKIYFDRNLYNLKILVIDLVDNAENDRYKLIFNQENIYLYNLSIHKNSYTGGVFLNDADNDNYFTPLKI